MRMFVMILAIIVGVSLAIIELVNIYVTIKQTDQEDYIEDLEKEIKALKEDIEDLQEEYDNFRAKVEDKFYIK